jgi:uncharacterized protein YndB with AHSA1/START domain
MRDESSVVIAAPADGLWGMVADVTRMPEWSPETVRCEWADGATGPAIGARFKGSNRLGPMRWTTKPKVVACEPGRVFAFCTMPLGHKVTTWTYTFEPVEGGTRVTESYEIDSPLRVLIPKRRRAQMLAGMEQTLARLKAGAERA